MRVKNSINNIVISVISFVVTLILTFILRKIMVLNIGYEYIGLNVFLTSIIGFLSLGELGVSQAITYSLYKPLSEKNNLKIAQIIVLFKKVYYRIGTIIFGLSLLFMCVIKRFIEDTKITNIPIYFFIYVLMTISSYYLCYRDILINADQKGYLLKRINILFTILNKVLQILILVYTKSYFYWLLTCFLITIINYLYNNYYVKRLYKDIDLKKYNNHKIKELLSLNPGILKNAYATFVYKLSLFITYKTDDILITNLVGIAVLGKYSNYVLVISLVGNFIAGIFWSLNSIVGNYIVENSDDNSYKMWKNLNFISIYIATVIGFSIYINIKDFLILWIGKETILDNSILYILLINFYIRIIREPLELFKNGFGIFDGTKKIVVFEAFLNLIISYYLGKVYGILGIILGTLISYLLGCFWFIPYITFKKGFKKSQFHYYKVYLSDIFISIISIIISKFILNKLQINNFILSCMSSFLIINFIYLALNIKNNRVKFILNILIKQIKKK